MAIIAVGVSYKNTHLEVREKLAFSKKKLEVAYKELTEIFNEAVILSTCNRSEIYAVAEEGPKGIETVKEFFCRFHGLTRERMDRYFYTKQDKDCVEYLFTVAAGLDSQVLGEDQILGQVKEAHSFALEQNAAGKILNRLFQDSIAYGKKIREKTKISQNPTSISYLAVRMLKKKMPDTAGKNVLLVGAGKMNRLALTYLKDLGFAKIFVANRTQETAESLKRIFPDVRIISFKELSQYIPLCHVVISSTSAPHLVVTRGKIDGYQEGSIYIDMAVPRDIDPAVGTLKGITLVDLDMLKQLAEENQDKRQKAAEEAEELVREGMEEFFAWFNCLPLFPVIKQIESYHKHILDKEMPRLVGRLKNAEDEQKIGALLKSFVKKIYAGPVIRLKEYPFQNTAPEDLAYLLAALYQEE